MSDDKAAEGPNVFETTEAPPARHWPPRIGDLVEHNGQLVKVTGTSLRGGDNGDLLLESGETVSLGAVKRS